jgi:hypothetical protein
MGEAMHICGVWGLWNGIIGVNGAGGFCILRTGTCILPADLDTMGVGFFSRGVYRRMKGCEIPSGLSLLVTYQYKTLFIFSTHAPNAFQLVRSCRDQGQITGTSL